MVGITNEFQWAGIHIHAALLIRCNAKDLRYLCEVVWQKCRRYCEGEKVRGVSEVLLIRLQTCSQNGISLGQDHHKCGVIVSGANVLHQ